MNSSGGSRGGVWGPRPSPLILKTKRRPEGRKMFLGDDAPPPLISGSGWLPPSLISRSGSGIEFPAMHAEYHRTKQHICFKTPTYSKCHSCFHFSRIEINYKVKKKKFRNPLLSPLIYFKHIWGRGVNREGGLFTLAKMMVSVLHKN